MRNEEHKCDMISCRHRVPKAWPLSKQNIQPKRTRTTSKLDRWLRREPQQNRLIRYTRVVQTMIRLRPVTIAPLATRVYDVLSPLSSQKACAAWCQRNQVVQNKDPRTEIPPQGFARTLHIRVSQVISLFSISRESTDHR